MKRAKKRPLPITRQYDSDDDPLTDARHAAIKTAADKNHGRTRYKLADLMAQIPPGTKFEEWDIGPPVGREIL